MASKVRNTLTFTAFYAAGKVAKTGIVVNIFVYDPDGTLIVDSGLCTEVGNGFYRYTVPAASVVKAGAYMAKFTTSDGTVNMQDMACYETVELSSSRICDDD